MRFKVDVLRSAQKNFAKIAADQQNRILQAIKELEANPRPATATKLVGRTALRIRVGDYRVIYEVHDQQARVLVVVISHRKDAYR